MRLSVISAAVCLLNVAAGCTSQAPAPAPAANAVQAPATPDQPAAARAHVQQFIDRLMGGDQSVKSGLLGLTGVDFDTIESIDIRSAVPMFSADGKKIDNVIRVQIAIRGYDGLKRRDIERIISRDVSYNDGKWKIIGANF